MKAADTAMYAAKSRGRNNFQFFSPVMNNDLATRFFHIEQVCAGPSRKANSSSIFSRRSMFRAIASAGWRR